MKWWNATTNFTWLLRTRSAGITWRKSFTIPFSSRRCRWSTEEPITRASARLTIPSLMSGTFIRVLTTKWQLIVKWMEVLFTFKIDTKQHGIWRIIYNIYTRTKRPTKNTLNGGWSRLVYRHCVLFNPGAISVTKLWQNLKWMAIQMRNRLRPRL